MSEEFVHNVTDRLICMLRSIFVSGNTSIQSINSATDAIRAVYDNGSGAIRISMVSGETSIKIEELSDVDITNPQTGQLLSYNESSEKLENTNAIYSNEITINDAEIKEINLPSVIVLGDVIEDGTNVWDMFEETGGMYIEYKGLPSTFPQFVEDNYIAFIASGVQTGVYLLKIVSITQESASTSGDYTGDMTFLH